MARPPLVPKLRLRHHPSRPRRHGGGAGRCCWRVALHGRRGRRPARPHSGRDRRPAGLSRRSRGEGQVLRHDQRAARPDRGRGRWGQLENRSGTRHPASARVADGHGHPGLLRVPRLDRRLHRIAPRHPRRGGQHRPGLWLDLPARRRSDQRGRRPAVDRPPMEGRQHHQADGHLRQLRPRPMGDLLARRHGTGHRGTTPHGLRRRTPHRAHHDLHRRCLGINQPLQWGGDRLRL